MNRSDSGYDTAIWETRARELAGYIIEHGATVRQAAAQYSVSKSTVHKDVAERLKSIDPSLYSEVKEVLERNKAQRHIRGGAATKRKYLERAKRCTGSE